MLDAGKIALLKEKVDLVKLFESYGHLPRQQGSSVKVLCPFHTEDTPSLSINLKTNLWQCFGCGEAGDAISLMMKLEDISFLAAARKLSKLEGVELESQITPINANDANNTESFEKVANYYHQTFLNSSAGREYLQSRGFTNESLFEEYQLGFCDGTLLGTLDKTSISKLTELGIILENGKERFLGCVVFPLYDKNLRVVSFYGRHIKTGHFYLPGQRQGIFNLKQLKEKRPDTLIITESIIDALSFINKGLDKVYPIYGTNGFTPDHLALINEIQPAEIIIALDGDEQGQAASLRLKEKLTAECSFSFSCRIVTFPNNQDANEYFQKQDKADFKQLIGTVLAVEFKNPKTQKLRTDRYQFKHIDQKGGKLTVTLKVENPETKRFVLDTVNLYSQRQRESLTKSVMELFQERIETVEAEVIELIYLAEQKAKQLKTEWDLKDEETVTTMSEAEKQEALSFLKNPKLFEEIVHDYETLGYVGEESNKQLAYLVMTSRRLANPLSLIIVSSSAAGKSSLQKATMELCPAEDGKHFTRLTQQSLYYLGEDSIKHKFLSIEEEAGAEEASYSLKTLLSSKELTVVSTTQDPITGKKRADEYKTEGPVAVMVSTTNPTIEPEMASRTLVISIDETREQTQSIQIQQRYSRTAEGRTQQLKEKTVQRKHHNAQRLLSKDLIVVNDYAPKLQFPTDRLKYRRSNAHYLDLIDTIAFLRQHQKPIKSTDHLAQYIEVDKSDIQIANGLFYALMGWQIDELTPPTRKLLLQIVEYCGDKGVPEFSRREIREHYKWGNTHLHNHLRHLEEMEYLVSINGSNGSKYQYQLVYTGDIEFLKDMYAQLIDTKNL